MINIFNIYAQENCDINNYKHFSNKELVAKVGKKHLKRLKESFTIFEDLLKAKKTELFLEKADDDFRVFNNDITSLIPILNQLDIKTICIDTIEVDAFNRSTIFFKDTNYPDDKMFLEISETFKYLSWNNAGIQINGSIHLEGDIVKIPIKMIKDWPFIDGEINGVKGHWMFDTGNGDKIQLHSRKIKNLESKKIGSGFVGSGQTFDVIQYPLIEKIKIGNFTFKSIKNITGNDYVFLEPITPTVLGQIGFDFFKGYDMKIDYLRSELTFYKQKEGIENWKDIKNHKDFITSLPYFTRALDNHPMIKVQHEGVEFLVTFDTGGGKGTFTMEDSVFKKIKNSGNLENFYETSSPFYNWYNIKINEHLTVDLYGLRKQEDSPSHKPLQINEKNTFSLDHSFLSQYITIWDTKNKVIHVLKKK